MLPMRRRIKFVLYSIQNGRTGSSPPVLSVPNEVGVALDLADGRFYTRLMNRILRFAASTLALFITLAHSAIAGELEDFYEWGTKAQENRDFDRAIACWNSVLHLKTNDAIAYFNRAKAYGSKGDLDESISDFTSAIQINTNYADAYKNRALAYAFLRDLDKSISDLGEVIRINPKDTNAYISRAMTYMVKGHPEKAMSDYSEVIRLNPKSSDGYDIRGSAWFRMGDMDKAIEDFSTAMRLNTNDTAACMSRGLAWYQKRHFEKAIADFDRIIAANPKNSTAFDKRAYAKYAKGDYAEALSDEDEALRLSPSNAEALNNRAWFLATCPADSIRNGKLAVEAARKACELTQWKERHCVGTLAAAYAEAGDFDQAVKYQKMVQQAPGLTPQEREQVEHRLTLFEQLFPTHETP
jgi:tetratricopeptide (TPR) repeat protein